MFFNIIFFCDCFVVDFFMFEIFWCIFEIVFVFLMIGGGIRDIVDVDGIKVLVFEIVIMYFKFGVDKVFIGLDVVIVVEEYYNVGKMLFGNMVIE